MRTLQICVIDYGVGNVGSIANFVKSLGHIPLVSSSGSDMDNSDVIVLPGVGSAVKVAPQLQDGTLRDSIIRQHELNKPLIGLCLGAQLLFNFLAESNSSGLKIIEGDVTPIDTLGTVNTGWRKLNWQQLKGLGIATALKEKDTYFFNHEFEMVPRDSSIAVCLSTGPEVTAIVNRGKTWAIQFHPEKSQLPGKILMRNVLNHAGC
jgi:glutamine amidotransferase